MAYRRPKDIFDLLDQMAGADLSLPERTVLVQQYKYADRDGRNSYVSEKRLAEDLFTTDKTIRNHRQKLRTKTWLIERTRGKNVSGDKASVYDVVIPLFQKPATRVRRKANNAAGWNQHRKKSSSGTQEDLTSNPSSPEEEIFHLSTDRKHGSEAPLHDGDEEQQHSSIAVEAGQPDGESGCAAAHREVPSSAAGDDPVASGRPMAGTSEHAALLRDANETPEEPPMEDPWGAPPPPGRNGDYIPRTDLPAGAA